jgi:hypothetical protein
MVIKIEPTRKKMRKNICNCCNGIETDIILKHRSTVVRLSADFNEYKQQC